MVKNNHYRLTPYYAFLVFYCLFSFVVGGALKTASDNIRQRAIVSITFNQPLSTLIEIDVRSIDL